MEILLTIRDQDIDPKAPIVDSKDFAIRESARAVVLDKDDGVYLLKVNLHNYHKLPGGGVNEGEDILKALQRELLEEIGCEARVIAEIGLMVEYKDQFKLKHTSHCFLTRQTGEQVASSLEQDELADGFEEVKAKSIAEAIEILSQDEPNDYQGKFIKMRDTVILRAAEAILNSKS